ncbi:MAG: UDP-N-acetylglucosamine 1-carboxyvinyltransferase [Pirellulales bacterium]|nr:UDP-N-acetylglucosamine 1-carboxyvinyltransferase [Pirellulales bacterium]
MGHLEILGGPALSGTVRVGGAKNAALPIMAAALLAPQPVELRGVPRLGDVDTLSRLLESLGVRVSRQDDRARLETVDPTPVKADYELVRRMRASFCVLGPLLARRGSAVVALPGGCAIGDRPVDLHLSGLRALGAELTTEHGYVVARAPRLVGATMDLTGPRGPSVTATANVMSAAVLAEGLTTVAGAAVEPEVVDLGRFLVALGAKIEGLGTPTLRIHGPATLGGAAHAIIPDRIEAATLLLAAAITGGDVRVEGVRPEHLGKVLAVLKAIGRRVETGSNWARVRGGDRPKAIDVTARPYPGVPSDLQAQWMAVLSLADGRGVVRDMVFPGRFMHVAELKRLGARIEVVNGAAHVTGVERLGGADVAATDLRAGAALALAGLAAHGRTNVFGLEHLDRGYERLDEKLAALGARVRRVPLA